MTPEPPQVSEKKESFKPIVYLAFANDQDDHLALLDQEQTEIQHIFQELGEGANRAEVLIQTDAELESLSKLLNKYRDRITIFHYGGHANSESIRLADGVGYIEGLSRMLGRMPELKLVFLNGCATKNQVDYLLENKVKAVIATRVKIGDHEALEFSKAFYRSFAIGNTLKESYEQACDFLMLKYKNRLIYQINKRSMGLESETEELTEASKWALFYNDENVLMYRGVGTEADKALADSVLIGLINRFTRKIPIRILLAVSTHEKLPNGEVSPVNVYNEIALIKEYIHKLFIYSNFRDTFDIQVYLLKDRQRALLIAGSDESVAEERELDLPNLRQIDLITWVIWNNMGTVDDSGIPALSWLYRQAYELPESEQPSMQLFRRGEAIPDFVTHTKDQDQSIMERVRTVDQFFSNLSGNRVIDYHPDLFEEAYEHHLRIWLKKFVRKVYQSDDKLGGKTVKKSAFTNPYKGLKPYQYDDANVFFGRINEVDALRDTLAESQHAGLLAVIGASGSGKSSLVRAGLFNRLRLNAIPGSRKWRILECQLDGDLRIQQREIWQRPGTVPGSDLKISDLIATGRVGAARLIKTLMQGLPANARLVLFFDQFEEVFNLIDEQQGAVRQQLLQFLIHFSQSDQGQVILTMRSEYFHRSLDYPNFAELLKNGQEVVLPPGRESMIRIIVRPAMFSGLRFEKGLEMKVWEDAGQVDGTLPLVSYVLEQLVKDREGDLLTFKAYEALGGVVGVVQQQADLAVAKFDTDSKNFREDFNFLFRKLVKVQEGGLVGKRPAPLDEENWPAGAVALKNELVNKRLLISDGNTLEITHEALLRHWDLLSGWILEVRSALLTLARAGKEAQDWFEDRQTLQDQQARIELDRIRLWPHERLQLVYDAQDLLGIDEQEMEALYPHSSAFLRDERDRLTEELVFDFVDHQRRDDIGNRLAILGDRRRGIGLQNGRPDIVWCAVPGGVVRVPEIDRAFEIAPFYISKYSVTLLQYNVFAKDFGKYFDKRWWEDLPIDPGDYKPKTQSPEVMTNRPAEWVNWYHAVAYCRWLSHELGYTVRLPKEWEWQQAACNGQPANTYPWGPNWEVNRANSSEGIGRLMAVGLYPHGRAENGAMDLAGNVYEWCYNAYDVDNDDFSINNHRTTKGGSWGKIGGEAEEVLKATYRFKDFPSGTNERGYDIRAGFRLVADELPPDALLDQSI